jgi:hypothetical protein
MPGLKSASGIQRNGVVLRRSQAQAGPRSPALGRLAAGGDAGGGNRGGRARALVFSQFAAMRAILKRHLEATFGREVLFLAWRRVQGARDEIVARSTKEDGAAPPIFALSLPAAIRVFRERLDHDAQCQKVLQFGG